MSVRMETVDVIGEHGTVASVEVRVELDEERGREVWTWPPIDLPPGWYDYRVTKDGKVTSIGRQEILALAENASEPPPPRG